MPASSAAIIAVIARRYEITTQMVKTGSRTGRVARARAIAMYLARTIARESYPQIGKAFGGKHHTTVMHNVARVEADPKLLAEAQEYIPEKFDEEERIREEDAIKTVERAMRQLHKSMEALELVRISLRCGR